MRTLAVSVRVGFPRGREEPHAGRVRSPDGKLASFMEGIMADCRRLCGLLETKNGRIEFLGD